MKASPQALLSPMPPLNQKSVIAIAGGGIAGLSCAIACAPFVHSAHLFEQSPQLSEVGAGLQLMPNATQALKQLGVLEEMLTKASLPSHLGFYDGKSGKTLTQLALPPLSQHLGAPYICVHRADLLEVLAQKALALPNVILHTNCAILSAKEHKNEITLNINKNKKEIEKQFDFLIGADGIWSKTRQSLHPTTSTKNSHRTAYRTHIPTQNLNPNLQTQVHVFLHPSGAHMVCYPMRAGTLLNIVLVEAGQPQTSPTPQTTALPWCETAQSVLNQTQGWLPWPLHDLNPIPTHLTPRSVLVGDAAHAVLPHMAQGAAQALQDAATLHNTLQMEQPLSATMPQRLKAAQRVQALSRRNGQIYALTGLPATLRNTTLKTFGKGRIEKSISIMLDFNNYKS